MLSFTGFPAEEKYEFGKSCQYVRYTFVEDVYHFLKDFLKATKEITKKKKNTLIDL